jgi:hypothetical protein
MNRIKLESPSRWRAIPIGEWAIEYMSVRCYMNMYMIAQPENPTFFFQMLGSEKGEPKADLNILKRGTRNGL